MRGSARAGDTAHRVRATHVNGVDDDVPEFLRAVGEQLRAAAVHFVRSGRSVASRWTDYDEPDAVSGTIAPDVVESLARDWLLAREPHETSAVRSVDGWWLAFAAVGAPSLPLDGALVAVRDPGSPIADTECELLVFAGRALSSLTGTAPLGSEREWRRSGHRAGMGLQSLCQGLDGRNGMLSAFAVRLDLLSAAADVLGGGAADEIIRTTRRRIERWAGTGRVLQLAGADFLVLRDDHADATSAAADADRLRHLLVQPVDVGTARVSRTASIGVATSARRAVSASVLLATAFGALREAQASGGNAVRVDGEAQSCQLERLRLEVELQRAVQNEALRLYYQPEYDLRSGALLGVEALLRWQHPERGLLHPDEFIDVAEASQSMTDVGEWVLREALRQLAQWQAEFPRAQLTMRVNVAASQFGSDNLVDLILHEIGRHGLRSRQVCVEITERTMPTNLGDISAGLAALRKAGVQSAIDDFGTGQSSFAHLRQLPVHAIKIDRGFVAELPADVRSRGIVTSMVQLADVLGLDVVAEGVESHEVAAELIRLGCSRAQGNLLGAAMRAEQIRGLLQAAAVAV